MKRTPLASWHQHQGARFSNGTESATPLTFSGVESEYRVAKERVVLVERSPLGRIKAIGPDTLDLLNRLSTNYVEGLAPGEGALTVLTTNKGRVLDWVTVLRLENHVLLLTSPGATQVVTDWIDKHTIIEEVTLEDITTQTAMLGVIGPKADDLLGDVLGVGVRELPLYHSLLTAWRNTELLVARTDPVGFQGYDLVVPIAHAEALCDAFLEVGAPAGMVPMGEEAFEVLRVEAGIPLYGHELSESYNPLEAGLLDSISWTKGCYIGQEVVARLQTYHKVQRYLVTIAFEGQAVPPAGGRLLVEGKDVGVLTSTAYSYEQNRPLALGYLRTAYVKQGLQVEASLSDGQTVTGIVVRVPELPEAAITPAQLLALAEEEAAEAE